MDRFKATRELDLTDGKIWFYAKHVAADRAMACSENQASVDRLVTDLNRAFETFFGENSPIEIKTGDPAVAAAAREAQAEIYRATTGLDPITGKSI